MAADDLTDRLARKLHDAYNRAVAATEPGAALGGWDTVPPGARGRYRRMADHLLAEMFAAPAGRGEG